jgi:hypothetical protein
MNNIFIYVCMYVCVYIYKHYMWCTHWSITWIRQPPNRKTYARGTEPARVQLTLHTQIEPTRALTSRSTLCTSDPTCLSHFLDSLNHFATASAILLWWTQSFCCHFVTVHSHFVILLDILEIFLLGHSARVNSTILLQCLVILWFCQRFSRFFAQLVCYSELIFVIV